jgi:hypothetical protein
MTVEECKQLLAKIQLGDNRQVDRLVILEWFETIGHLKFEDARGAVTLHRQESTEYLTAAHVCAGARRVRELRERAERVNAFRAIESNQITLDRAEFDRLTAEAVAQFRQVRS